MGTAEGHADWVNDVVVTSDGGNGAVATALLSVSWQLVAVVAVELSCRPDNAVAACDSSGVMLQRHHSSDMAM